MHIKSKIYHNFIWTLNINIALKIVKCKLALNQKEKSSNKLKTKFCHTSEPRVKTKGCSQYLSFQRVLSEFGQNKNVGESESDQHSQLKYVLHYK